MRACWAGPASSSTCSCSTAQAGSRTAGASQAPCNPLPSPTGGQRPQPPSSRCYNKEFHIILLKKKWNPLIPNKFDVWKRLKSTEIETCVEIIRGCERTVMKHKLAMAWVDTNGSRIAMCPKQTVLPYKEVSIRRWRNAPPRVPRSSTNIRINAL